MQIQASVHGRAAACSAQLRRQCFGVGLMVMIMGDAARRRPVDKIMQCLDVRTSRSLLLAPHLYRQVLNGGFDGIFLLLGTGGLVCLQRLKPGAVMNIHQGLLGGPDNRHVFTHLVPFPELFQISIYDGKGFRDFSLPGLKGRIA